MRYRDTLCVAACALALGAGPPSSQPAPEELPGMERPKPKPPKAYASPRFSFEVPGSWQGPKDIAGGVRYFSRDGRALLAIVFQRKGSSGYRTPLEFRRRMRQLLSTEDNPVIEIVRVSGRLSSRSRHTSHVYGGTELLGEAKEVFLTEFIMVPDPEGIYVIEYRSRKDEFEKNRRGYLAFLRSLRLPRLRPYAPDKYYRRRDNLVRDLIEERAPTDFSGHDQEEVKLQRSYEFSPRIGPASPMGDLSGSASLGSIMGVQVLRRRSEKFAWGGELSYFRYGGKEVSLPTRPAGGEAAIEASGTAVILALLGRYSFYGDHWWTPYAAFGLGLHRFSLSIEAKGDEGVEICKDDFSECGRELDASSLGLAVTLGGGVDLVIGDTWTLFAGMRLYRMRVGGDVGKMDGDTFTMLFGGRASF